MRFSEDFLSKGLKKRKAAGTQKGVPSKKPKQVNRVPSSPTVTVAGQRRKNKGSSLEEIVTEIPSAPPQTELPTGIPIPQPRGESVEDRPSPAAEARDEIPEERGAATPPIDGAEESLSPSHYSFHGEDEAPVEEGLSSRPAGVNAMRRGRLAERVLSRSTLPNLQAELRRQPLEKSLDVFFIAFLQASNSAFVLRDACLGRSGDQRQNLSELEALKSQMDVLIREVAEVKARESATSTTLEATVVENQGLKGLVEESEKKNQELKIKLAEATAGLTLAKEELTDTLLRATQAEERASAAEDRAELLELEARVREERLATVEERSNLTEEKLSWAEGELASAQGEIKRMLAKLTVVEVQANEKIMAVQTEAFLRVSASDKRAQSAVEAYKNSPEFAAECSEAAIDAYAKGFERCKEKIRRLYSLSGLENIQPVDREAGDDSNSSEG